MVERIKIPVRHGKVLLPEDLEELGVTEEVLEDVGKLYRDRRNEERVIRVVKPGPPVEKANYSKGTKTIRVLPTWYVVSVVEHNGKQVEVRQRIVRDENIGHDYAEVRP